MCAVFCCGGIVNDINDRDVVGASEFDDEGAGAGFAGGIGNGLVDRDLLGCTSSEGVVCLDGGIERPSTCLLVDG